MRKLFYSIFTFLSLCLFSQEKMQIIPNKVFATLDDMLNGKPVPGVRVFQILADGPVLRDDQDKKMKVKALGMKDYYLTEENNGSLILAKSVDGDIYSIMYLGKLSLFDRKGQEYYSEGPSGEMIKLSRKKFDEFLEQYNLKDQWHADKEYSIQAKDGVYEAALKRTLKKAKYFRIISEKMK